MVDYYIDIVGATGGGARGDFDASKVCWRESTGGYIAVGAPNECALENIV